MINDNLIIVIHGAHSWTILSQDVLAFAGAARGRFTYVPFFRFVVLIVGIYDSVSVIHTTSAMVMSQIYDIPIFYKSITDCREGFLEGPFLVLEILLAATEFSLFKVLLSRKMVFFGTLPRLVVSLSDTLDVGIAFSLAKALLSRKIVCFFGILLRVGTLLDIASALSSSVFCDMS